MPHRPATAAPADVFGPRFVSRATAAALIEISVDTFDLWVADGFLPGPRITRGQIRRWHWPSIEARLAGGQPDEDDESDVYITGVRRDAKSNARSAS